MNDDQLDLGASFEPLASQSDKTRARRRRAGSRVRPGPGHRRRRRLPALRQGDPPDQAGQALLQAPGGRPHRHGRLHGVGGRSGGPGSQGGRPGDGLRPGHRVPGQGPAGGHQRGRGAAGRRAAPGFPPLHLPRHRGAQGLPAVPHRLGVRPRLRRSARAHLRRPGLLRDLHHRAGRQGLPPRLPGRAGGAHGRAWPRCATSWPSSTAGSTATCCSPPRCCTTSARRGSWRSRPPSTSPTRASSWDTSSRGSCWCRRRRPSCRRSPKPSSSSCSTASSAITESWSGARPSGPRPSRRSSFTTWTTSTPRSRASWRSSTARATRRGPTCATSSAGRCTCPGRRTKRRTSCPRVRTTSGASS